MVAHPDIEAVYRIEGANFLWNIPAHCGRVERKPIGLGRMSRTTGLKMMTATSSGRNRNALKNTERIP